MRFSVVEDTRCALVVFLFFSGSLEGDWGNEGLFLGRLGEAAVARARVEAVCFLGRVVWLCFFWWDSVWDCDMV